MDLYFIQMSNFILQSALQKKYEEMIETLEDYQLYIEAEKRLKSASESDFIGQDDVLKTFHISQKDLNEADEAEIEQ